MLHIQITCNAEKMLRDMGRIQRMHQALWATLTGRWWEWN
jgi:hypothetical protein